MSRNDFSVYNISSFVFTLLIAFVTWVILMSQTLWNGSLFPTYPDDVDNKKDRKNWEIGIAIFIATPLLLMWFMTG